MTFAAAAWRSGLFKRTAPPERPIVSGSPPRAKLRTGVRAASISTAVQQKVSVDPSQFRLTSPSAALWYSARRSTGQQTRDSQTGSFQRPKLIGEWLQVSTLELRLRHLERPEFSILSV